MSLQEVSASPLYVCEYLWGMWLVVWIAWAFQTKRTQQREGAGSRVSYAILGWAAMYLMFDGRNLQGWWHDAVFPYKVWIGWWGVGVAAVGFGLTIWARAILGSNWSGTVTIKVGHELVRTGPYRWVRHPIYTGLIVAVCGTFLARDEWRGVASIALLWLSFTIKRLKEEEFMYQTFGEQYAEYSRTTGAIFPSLLRRGS